ncbi:FUSC family protein [Acetobacteraceae bacterium ESL0709]|nr:FUSC family protein [Acetobacteraceae bacterium ESL0697]MDF7677691.1 FUSC family protein [Acetobacteraceae bacterium ESL0709]
MKQPLLQPNTLSAVLFSLRTTVISLVALAIAFWMELDEPQWAAMTVWIVAQNSRGMSHSKGKWRIIGTLGGVVSAIVLIALYPQYPWLFFISLALLAGLCTGLSSVTNNFRSYALVLVAYTGAIIALSALERPDQVFNIAVARGTYIVLGVICEMVGGMICVPNSAEDALEELHKRLSHLIGQSAAALAGVARGEEKAVSALSSLLGSLQKFNDSLEFVRIATQRAGGDIDRAHQVLTLVAIVLSRGLGLHSRLMSVGELSPSLQKDLSYLAEKLEELPAIMDVRGQGGVAVDHLKEISALFHQKLQSSLMKDDDASLKASIILSGIDFVLKDFITAISAHHFKSRDYPLTNFPPLSRKPDWGLAFSNAGRTVVALLIGAVLWEVTAWSEGPAYLSMLAVVCTRFATFDNTVLVSRQFFYGACWAVIASIIPVFFVMPITSSYVLFGLATGVIMFIGGLGLRYPPLLPVAASFSTFFVWALGLDNQARIDEMSWFNTCLALLLALWSGVVIFQVVLPFTAPQAWRTLRHHLVAGLRRLLLHSEHVSKFAQINWVADTTQRMEQVFRYAGQLPQHHANDMVKGTLSIMTVGRNLLMLDNYFQSGRLSREVMDEGEKIVRALIAPPSGKENWDVSPVLDLHASLVYLRESLAKSYDFFERRDIVLALGSLMIVRFEFLTSRIFLTKPIITSGKSEGLG